MATSDDLDNPMCICGHRFYDHDVALARSEKRGCCDICDPDSATTLGCGGFMLKKEASGNPLLKKIEAMSPAVKSDAAGSHHDEIEGNPLLEHRVGAADPAPNVPPDYDSSSWVPNKPARQPMQDDSGATTGLRRRPDYGESSVAPKQAAAKIKWHVHSAPTGRYRSFERRGWPSADYTDDGNCAARISCEDEYRPDKVKLGQHAPLTVYVADWSITPEERKRTGAGGFEWRKLKGQFATLKEAREAAARIIDAHPEIHARPEKPADAVLPEKPTDVASKGASAQYVIALDARNRKEASKTATMYVTGIDWDGLKVANFTFGDIGKALRLPNLTAKAVSKQLIGPKFGVKARPIVSTT